MSKEGDEMATLFLVCGKIAAGKSTLCKRLAEKASALIVSEDAWLSTLYPGEIKSLDDFVRCSGRLRSVMGPHLVSLLRLGLSMVLDFPANTIATRRWMRSIAEDAKSSHELHFLDVSDEICKERLHQRNQSGAHEYHVSEETFELFTRYFVPPSPEEGFSLIVHQAPG
jgi:predicted kinase